MAQVSLPTNPAPTRTMVFPTLIPMLASSCVHPPCPQAPSVSAFEFLGYGGCMDMYMQSYERFIVNDMGSLDSDGNSTFWRDDLSQCACPICEEYCEATPECIGYEFQ